MLTLDINRLTIRVDEDNAEETNRILTECSISVLGIRKHHTTITFLCGFVGKHDFITLMERLEKVEWDSHIYS